MLLLRKIKCADNVSRIPATTDMKSCSRLPRIEHTHSHTLKVGYIPGRDSQTVHEGRRCYEGVTIGAEGRVGLGSMPVPKEMSVESLSGGEEAYFASEFTHPSGAARLTNHPGGFLGLWSSLRGKTRFPVRFLARCGRTLQEFVQNLHGR